MNNWLAYLLTGIKFHEKLKKKTKMAILKDGELVVSG